MSLMTAWYNKSRWLYLLWPASVVYRALSRVRRSALQRSRAQSGIDIPVIVVGNITVGGTGKTPVVIALGKFLRERGLRPGVISRGYGGKAPHYPFSVQIDSPVQYTGDEALLIARALKCPVIVDPDRLRARNELLTGHSCDVIISDDGLQHYALPRDIELVVIDGARGLGNALCLPAGPLREAPARLRQVDYIVVNSGSCAQLALQDLPCSHMELQAVRWVNLCDGAAVGTRDLPLASGGAVYAMAGIGNPQRFFDTVSSLGYEALYHAFPDHYNFRAADLAFADDAILLMTSKDAVKCQAFARANYWYLEVEARLDPALLEAMLARLVQMPADDR